MEEHRFSCNPTKPLASYEYLVVDWNEISHLSRTTWNTEEKMLQFQTENFHRLNLQKVKVGSTFCKIQNLVVYKGVCSFINIDMLIFDKWRINKV